LFSGLDEIPIEFNRIIDTDKNSVWKLLGKDKDTTVTSFCKNEDCFMESKNRTAYCGNYQYDVTQKLPKWDIYFRNDSINVNKDNIGHRSKIKKHRNINGRGEPWYINPYNSGEKYTAYNRGHLVPFAGMKYTMKSALSTFLFTNMAPQNNDIIEGSWNDLEKQVEEFGKGKIFLL
jgi:hypothetical protein